MKRLVKYFMKALYANENYAKYGIPGMNYFIALMGATFYIMITGFLILFIFMAAFPHLYIRSTNSKIPFLPSATISLGLIFLCLRFTVKEESLKDDSFTKEKANKAMNYLLTYGFVVAVSICFLGLKFLRHYKGLA
jgi:hypothetical protein